MPHSLFYCLSISDGLSYLSRSARPRSLALPPLGSLDRGRAVMGQQAMTSDEFFANPFSVMVLGTSALRAGSVSIVL